MVTDLPFDLVLLMLRVVFIFLLYFFLFQVVRVISRELTTPPATLPARAAGPAAPAAQPSLTLIDADQSDLPLGATYSLQPVTSVGRAADNVLPLADAFVSSHHARLVQTNGRWYVTDLGSTNGTFVNGAAAGSVAAPVADGDVLQFGRVKFRLSLPA